MKAIFNNRWAKLIRQLIYTVSLTAACIYCAIKPDVPFQIKIQAWVGIFLFGFGGMYAFIRDLGYNIKGKCWVQILEEGLLIGEMLIRWENIVGFRKGNGGVLVFTNNVDERLEEANFFKKWNIKFSLWGCKTDILAPELGFKGSCNAFIAQCQEEIRKFESKKQ